MNLGCLINRVARAHQSALGHGTARAHLTAREARLLFSRLLHNEPVLCYLCGVCVFCDISTLKFRPTFFFFGGRDWAEITFHSLSVQKSSVERTFLHWDLELNYFLYFRMSKIPSIEQCRQKSDKLRYTLFLRQHSWACMVSFPRRRGNKNAHFVHPSEQMRDTRYGMAKWLSSR